MSALARLSRSYAIHGVGVEVAAPDAAVIDAIDFRLRPFSTRDAQVAELRVEFIDAGQNDDGSWGRAAAVGRPVYDTPHGSLYYFQALDVLEGELAGVHLHCEPARGRAVVRSHAFRGRELYFATHPVATIALMELMERRGRFSLHAACLASPDGGGVLLAGPSGAGKSTLALALARAGLGFLTDDIVFLRYPDGGDGAIEALGFADAVGLGTFAADRFPELRWRMAEPPPAGFPKRLHRIEDMFGRPGVTRCEPRAIVFPAVAAGRRSEIAPLDRGDALLRLVPDVLLTEPTATQAHLGAIATLLDQVSCFTLRLGADLERAAEMVSALLSG